VSTLLADAQRATRDCSGQEQVRAFGLLALSYQAAAAVLTKTVLRIWHGWRPIAG
jgi:hypothetical protein